MANADLHQPELRAYPVFDTLPAGCIAFPVPNNGSYPHLRLGEFAVVDTAQREPIHGELYVLQWETGPSVPRLVETFRNSKLPGWCVGAPTARVDGVAGRWCDFGYREEHLARLLRGRVIGILEAAFDEGALQKVKG